jgi:hypothetical protein
VPHGSEDPARKLRRDREYWLGVLGRPALFVVWALVFWGTLIAGSLVVTAFELGPREALRRLDPVNGATVLLALAAWILVATAFLVGRRRRSAP